MSVTVTTSVHDKATPVVVAIAGSVKPAMLKRIVGRSAVQKFKTHFVGLNSERANVLGGERTNFYSKAAKATQWQDAGDGVMISVNQQGIRQRVLGGTITPKKAKFLTIPARAEAYGKRASAFNDLIILRRGDHHFGEPYALARAVSTSLTRRGSTAEGDAGGRRHGHGEVQGGEIMFWLKKSVTQRPDPSAVPTAFDLYAYIRGDVNSFIDRNAARGRQQGRAN